jgi:hypothetical protein
MAMKGVPQSAAFAYETAQRALDQQSRLIDSIDAKAGILLAADGILAGLIFGRETFISRAPVAVASVAGGGILLSLACALRALATRNYSLAPEPSDLAGLSAAPAEWIQWRLMGNMLDAVDEGRRRLRQKARWLTAGQGLLLVMLAPVGGYFLYAVFRGTG